MRIRRKIGKIFGKEYFCRGVKTETEKETNIWRRKFVFLWSKKRKIIGQGKLYLFAEEYQIGEEKWEKIGNPWMGWLCVVGNTSTVFFSQLVLKNPTEKIPIKVNRPNDTWPLTTVWEYTEVLVSLPKAVFSKGRLYFSSFCNYNNSMHIGMEIIVQ